MFIPVLMKHSVCVYVCVCACARVSSRSADVAHNSFFVSCNFTLGSTCQMPGRLNQE
jgi:hypothetical protein